jgi:predicted metalloprotease
VSSDKHTAKQLRKAGKERRVVKRVLWLSVRHGSILQKAHCQPSTKEVEVCGKKEATTCEKNAGERSKA